MTEPPNPDKPPRFIAGKPPREAPNADRPGEYRLAVRATDAEVDPGDEIRLELYITGYGDIHGSKLAFYPPAYFIDVRSSRIIMDLKRVEAKGEVTILWGGREERLSEETGGTMVFPGFQMKTWERPTVFFDMPRDPARSKETKQGPPNLFTEMKHQHAPVELILKVRDKVPSGNHNIQLFFTYFNGSEWKSDSQSVDVLVRNWVRRHELSTVIVGVSAAILALLATIGSLIFDVLSYIAS